MTAASTTLGIEVQVQGAQRGAQDLAVVDAAVRNVGTSTAQTGNINRQAANAADAAWEAHRNGARSAQQTVDAFAQSMSRVQNAVRSGNLRTQSAEIERIARSCGLSSASIERMVRSMEQVRRADAFEDLQRQAGLSTAQLARLRAEMGDVRGAFGTLASGAKTAAIAITAMTAALAFGGKACLDAALQADRLSKAYTTITGSSTGAAAQLAFLRETSDQLGLQFYSTAEAAKTFFAAGKGTSLEKELNTIFTAVSSAGTALALSTDDMQGVFLALGQMISKGKVQAEELRGQLGERLPGAFQLAAKAMGMTTAELDKFMADGKLTAGVLLPKLASVMQETFGGAAIQAAQGIQGQLNRLSTEWTDLKASFIDSGTAVAGIEAIRGAVGGLHGAIELIKQYGDEIKAVFVTVLAGSAVMALKTLFPPSPPLRQRKA